MTAFVLTSLSFALAQHIYTLNLEDKRSSPVASTFGDGVARLITAHHATAFTASFQERSPRRVKEYDWVRGLVVTALSPYSRSSLEPLTQVRYLKTRENSRT